MPWDLLICAIGVIRGPFVCLNCHLRGTQERDDSLDARPLTPDPSPAAGRGEQNWRDRDKSYVNQSAWYFVRSRSAHFSPIIMQVRHGLTPIMAGKIEASATRRRPTPRTRSSGSTTARGSSAAPIRQVPAG